MCWGSGVTTAPATATTYPVAFSAVPATILTAKGVATSTQVGVIKAADRTNTAFTPVMVNNNTITTGNYDYIAIGYWK